MEGVVSTLNSTSTPLAGGGTFTGTYENCQNFTELTVSVYGTHASSAVGLTVTWSHDGSTDMLVETLGTLPSTSPTARVYSFKVPIKAAYVKVAYVNGATLQTTFNLQTIFHYDIHATAAGLPRMGLVEVNGQLIRPTVVAVNITTAVTTSLAAGVLGTRHYVLDVNLTFSGAQTMSWLSAAAAIIQPMSFAANGQLVIARGPHGYWMKTLAGEALQVTTTAAINVRGTVVIASVLEL